MCPFQAMNSNIRIEIHTFSIENKKRRELLALHQRMFSGNKINIVRKNHPLFLGYLNEQLCAYASAQLNQKEGRLLYLGVDEKYRQQGIATALMAQVWNFYMIVARIKSHWFNLTKPKQLESYTKN